MHPWPLERTELSGRLPAKNGDHPGRKFDVTNSLAQMLKVELERKIRRRNALVKIHLDRHLPSLRTKQDSHSSLDLQSVSARLEHSLGRREITLVNPKIQIEKFPEREVSISQDSQKRAFEWNREISCVLSNFKISINSSVRIMLRTVLVLK